MEADGEKKKRRRAASGLSLAEIERYRLAVGTASRYFFTHALKNPTAKIARLAAAGRRSVRRAADEVGKSLQSSRTRS